MSNVACLGLGVLLIIETILTLILSSLNVPRERCVFRAIICAAMVLPDLVCGVALLTSLSA